ncbi:hypothetical protein [Seonamhaeicola maritimus]|uniref:GNAT family N-acetyltransferase n=1 Tax=Seonamhaeicola maritimus TaxID=2591822 RepID=A0A5C7GL52_9FLAO|nr:hypothetical protein [Seonamhaeicola maritimus]TXG38671.1 hypothetical protein FUA22_01960 [Seonamhaeicola maritimus]
MRLDNNLKITTLKSADKLDLDWDVLCDSTYQRVRFLKHIELYNYCNQKYYQAHKNEKLVAGAVVYSLKVNVLTFAKYELKLPMTIIGIPVSVDAQGIIGAEEYCETILDYIMRQEHGIILCLNYDVPIEIKKIIEMQTLPSMIFNLKIPSWEAYLDTMRHNHRRRILKAQDKFSNVILKENLCAMFTTEHYNLYLDVLKVSKTKLEVLNFDFFINLPSEFKLHSFYSENKLLAWHISTSFNNIYYFLFGGINYELRDAFDSYYNNLIQIIKEAIAVSSTTINFGQTAEVSKNRLGATPHNKKMFIYHKNRLVSSIFKWSKNLLTYSLQPTMVDIRKKNFNRG